MPGPDMVSGRTGSMPHWQVARLRMICWSSRNGSTAHPGSQPGAGLLIPDGRCVEFPGCLGRHRVQRLRPRNTDGFRDIRYMRLPLKLYVSAKQRCSQFAVCWF